MMVRLVVQPAAKRYFKKLKDKSLQQLFKNTIATIIENPSIGEKKHADLRGIQCVDIHYNQADYELAYYVTDIENEKGLKETVVIIMLAGTRENFYKELKRYWK